jgi:hypothetical protein
MDPKKKRSLIFYSVMTVFIVFSAISVYVMGDVLWKDLFPTKKSIESVSILTVRSGQKISIWLDKDSNIQAVVEPMEGNH